MAIHNEISLLKHMFAGNRNTPKDPTTLTDVMKHDDLHTDVVASPAVINGTGPNYDERLSALRDFEKAHGLPERAVPALGNVALEYEIPHQDDRPTQPIPPVK